MSHENWEGRYQTGDMPWDKGAPSPGLVDFLSSHANLPKGLVCVPGCGLGHDVRAWAREGYEAVGVDIAPSAIRLASEATNAAGLSARFLLSDFLSDPPPGQFDWLFEHTLYCAIQPSQRPDYIKAVMRWLKPSAQFLAVHYLIPDTEGPPFGTTREEILDRFSPHLTLLEEWEPRSYPNRTGLERIFWWKRR